MCDPQCATENCLFDGRDCDNQDYLGQCPFEDYCRKTYNDGNCDKGCNTAECAWDGLDCEISEDPDFAEGELDLVVDFDYAKLKKNQTYQNDMLRTLSIITKTSLTFKLDDNGKIIIEEVFSNSITNEKVLLINRQRRALRESNSRVFLLADNRGCDRTDGLTCYTSAKTVQGMIQAEYQRGNAATPEFNLLQTTYVPGK